MVTLLQPRIEADCRALRAGDEDEFVRVKEKLRTWENVESEEHFLKSLNNCSQILDKIISTYLVKRRVFLWHMS